MFTLNRYAVTALSIVASATLGGCAYYPAPGYGYSASRQVYQAPAYGYPAEEYYAQPYAAEPYGYGGLSLSFGGRDRHEHEEEEEEEHEGHERWQ